MDFYIIMSRTNNTTTPVERVFESNKLELEERILVFLYGAIGFLALLSNMALCAVLLRNRQMLQRAYNIIIFALATVDTLTGKLKEVQVCRDIDIYSFYFCFSSSVRN